MDWRRIDEWARDELETEAARMILGYEFQLEWPWVIPGHRLEHRLMWVRYDDGPQQARISGLIQGPVQHRLEPYRQDLLRQPPGNGLQTRPQPAAGYHRRVKVHE
jgi:hypothetical protein